jgi:hypothetical protein
MSSIVYAESEGDRLMDDLDELYTDLGGEG